MLVNHIYTQLKRRAKNGCIESMLDLAECYGKGKHGVQEDAKLFLKYALRLLDRLDDVRESEFSSALIFYEIMYAYFEQENIIMGEEYHHQLIWEIALDYPSGDLEPHFERFQVREIADYLGKDIESILDEVKAWQRQYDLETYTILDFNHFYTNK